jgi:hypothetical protein
MVAALVGKVEIGRDVAQLWIGNQVLFSLLV